MFKKFFTKEEDDFFETVDPVLEQRRKEKFSTPLIYNDDDEEKKEVKKEKVEKKPIEKKPTPAETPYVMSEIISPMSGVKQTNEPVKKPLKTKIVSRKKDGDELIPVISPFYGPSDFVEEEIPEDVQIVNVKEKKTVTVEEPEVQENLRNIADIVKEEQNQLKIIEERTGEFKLDFGDENDPTLIDEIDDSMSLDELMSLYEKKFKD